MSSGHVGYRERSQKWEARWRDADGRQRTKLFVRKRDAQRHLSLVLADTARGDYLDPARGRVKVAAVAEEWLASTGHLRANTVKGYEDILRAHVLPAFGSRYVATVTTADVRAFIAALTADGKAPGTVRNVYRVLKMVLQTAVDDDRIKKNPCLGVKLPASRTTEVDFLTAAEVSALAAAIEPRYRTVIYLAAYSGLRWGEIAALRWKHVDLMRGVVNVRESVKRVKGELQYNPPKTAAGRRSVRIPRFLVEMLSQEASQPYNGAAFVFTAERGGPMNYESVRHHFRKAAAVAVPKKPGLRFHDLRHTCASLLIAQGAHPKAIQRHLGHSTVVITLDRYSHLFPEESDRLADALDATYAAAQPEIAAETG